MAEESSFDPGENRGEFSTSFAPPPVPEPMVRSAYDLRPLTTGEILDRTFYLYRNNFWLFVGISAISAAAYTLSSIVQMLYQHFALAGVHAGPGTPAATIQRGVFSVLISLVATLLYLVVYSVSHAATTSAVTSIYLGAQTTMEQSFRAVIGRWLRFFAIAIWQGWSFMWLFLVLFIPSIVAVVTFHILIGNPGGMILFGFVAFFAVIGALVFGFISYIRNSLAVPVEVMESLPIRAAMRRSKDLAAGSKGRIFLLFLLLGILYIVLGAAQFPLTQAILKGGMGHLFVLQTALLFMNFVVVSLIGPVPAIGLSLFYIDQRVRKEGFDIQFMLDQSGPAPIEPAGFETPYAELP